MIKRLEKIALSHISLLIFWGILFKNRLMIDDLAILNYFSISLFFILYGLIYTEISNDDIQEIHSNLAIISSLLPLALILYKGINYRIILAFISISSTLLFIKKYMDTDLARKINILPISMDSAQRLTGGFVVFFFIVIYLFDIDTIVINLFMQIVFLLIEFFFILFLKEKENIYEKNYKIHYLSHYLAEERDEFARTIHDDIIQDIFASRNYLSLKNPDISYAREILRELEGKLRNIMKFYQSSLFEKANIDLTLSAAFSNISSLYKDKDIKITKIIEADLLEDPENIRLISTISKELINNIYKHSEASYINYKLYPKDDSLVMKIESDGVGPGDFASIKSSKRGIFLVKLLLEANSGTINYELNKDILTTEVVLEIRENENNITRRS